MDAPALRGLSDGEPLSLSMAVGRTVAFEAVAESIMPSLEVESSLFRIDWLPSFRGENMGFERVMATCGSLTGGVESEIW